MPWPVAASSPFSAPHLDIATGRGREAVRRGPVPGAEGEGQRVPVEAIDAPEAAAHPAPAHRAPSGRLEGGAEPHLDPRPGAPRGPMYDQGPSVDSLAPFAVLDNDLTPLGPEAFQALMPRDEFPRPLEGAVVLHSRGS